jgi:hypothetical protein
MGYIRFDFNYRKINAENSAGRVIVPDYRNLPANADLFKRKCERIFLSSLDVIPEIRVSGSYRR